MRCDNCRYVAPHPEDPESEVVLMCRRYPPVPLFAGVTLQGQTQTFTTQASTQAHFWCGEWREKEVFDA